MKTFSFESIGTKWQIDIVDKISEDRFEKIKESVRLFLKDFTNTYSRFDNESIVSKISKNKGRYKFPESALELFSIYKRLYDITEGKFTLLIGDTLSLAGYDAIYSLVPKKAVKPKKWSKVMDFSYPYLTTHEKIILDFGACGKGYAIDEISQILRNCGVKSFIIDAGGDLYVGNMRDSKIGLEHPNNPKQIIGTVNIDNMSICASSLNRRKWGKYSHIIDPHNLESPSGILSTWVVSEKAVMADALATALFLEKPEKFQKDFEFEYLILRSDFSILQSKNFPVEIYYNN